MGDETSKEKKGKREIVKPDSRAWLGLTQTHTEVIKSVAKVLNGWQSWANFVDASLDSEIQYRETQVVNKRVC